MVRVPVLVVSLLVAFAASAEDKIVVGATLPLTGLESKSAHQFKDGYDLAFALANEAGGLRVGGRRVPVELRVVDDASSPEKSAQLTTDLIEKDGIRFMLSSFSSRIVEKQSEVTEKHHVPLLMGSGSATAMFHRGYKYIYGLMAAVEHLAYAELRWIDAQQKAGKLPTPLRVAVAVEQTDHGADFRAGVLDFVNKTAARKAQYQVVFDESFSLDSKNHTSMLEKLKAAKADVFLADAHVQDFISIQREYQKMRLCHAVLSYGARGTERKAAEALGGSKAIDHVMSGVWWSAQTDNPQSKAFVAAFESRYHRIPEWYEALSYESARALFVAIENAGDANPEHVKHALDELEIPTLLPGGKLTFPKDNGHQARALFVVLQNQPDGSVGIIYPRDLTTLPGTVRDCGEMHASR